MVWQLCSMRDGVDVQTYALLGSCIDLDGLHDLLELQEVNASWISAIKRNIQEATG